jgi:predicted nucleic acid-binding protein
MTCLLDTNTISEATKSNPDETVRVMAPIGKAFAEAMANLQKPQ